MLLLTFDIKAQTSPWICPMELSPEQAQRVIERDKGRRNNNTTRQNMTRNVPVKIHIVRSAAGTGGLSAALAIDNITQANDFYSATTFNFFQCGIINYIDVDIYHALIQKSVDPNSNEQQMANTHKVAGALNVFFCENAVLANGNNASWAAFPDNPDRDWIVMRNSQAEDPIKSVFAHETGHWFDLYHTHQGNENVTRSNIDPCWNCNVEGDMLCDTPADNNNWTSGICVLASSQTDDCGITYNPLTTNLMSYAGQNCIDQFTTSQISRMHTSFDLDRVSHFAVNGACTVIGCTDPNAINYNASATTMSNGDCIYCSGTQVLASASGTFNDGSGAPEYGDNSNCKWIIQPTGINSFSLEFTSFFLETNYDFIRVYDGSTTSAPLLGTFTGVGNLPPTLTTSTGSMLVHFTTDGATTSYGFAATYYPINNPCQGVSTLNITSNPIPSGDYFASNKIIAHNPTVANPNIIMTAGKSIELTPGFDGVSNGQNTMVDMKVLPCGNNLESDEIKK